MNKEQIKEAIDDFEDYPLTEEQQHLVNYLRANIDDVEEALAD